MIYITFFFVWITQNSNQHYLEYFKIIITINLIQQKATKPHEMSHELDL